MSLSLIVQDIEDKSIESLYDLSHEYLDRSECCGGNMHRDYVRRTPYTKD